jgi:alpha-L-fucosidase 2
MLLQSRGGRLHLLPALPAAWPEGEVKGLRARGGFLVDMIWSGGEFQEAAIAALVDGPCQIAYRDREETIDMRAGQTYRLTPL